MKDLCIDDQTKTPISLTSIALALFTVNNTPLLCTSSIQAKFECINNYTKDTVDTTIMKIDPSKKTMVKRKKKKAKVQEKKSDNVSTDVPPSTSNPPDNDATVQSPTTSDTVIEEPQSTTSKIDSNPPNTTIQSNSTASTQNQSVTHHEQDSQSIIVIPPAVTTLVKNIDHFMTTCMKSEDQLVSDNLLDVKNHILNFINTTAKTKFDNWPTLSNLCPTGENLS